MGDLHFAPWQGPDYENERFKLMLLGQSHHLGGEPLNLNTPIDASDTIRLTEEFVAGSNRHPFWAKSGNLAAQFLASQGINHVSDPRQTFQKIAFYNFLTSYVSDHRETPSAEAVRASRPLLVKVLDKLQPDFVIALGIQRQPWFLNKIEQFQYVNTTERPFVAKYGKTTIVVCNHPQGQFSYEEALRLLIAGKRMAEEVL